MGAGREGLWGPSENEEGRGSTEVHSGRYGAAGDAGSAQGTRPTTPQRLGTGQAGARQDGRHGDHAALTRNECATVLNVS